MEGEDSSHMMGSTFMETLLLDFHKGLVPCIARMRSSNTKVILFKDKDPGLGSRQKIMALFTLETSIIMFGTGKEVLIIMMVVRIRVNL